MTHHLDRDREALGIAEYSLPVDDELSAANWRRMIHWARGTVGSQAVASVSQHEQGWVRPGIVGTLGVGVAKA